ncbi:MAG: DNA cytosine methyltransferase [Jatrophihabitans sp.]|uniref:DNA cytosine methyltransferase n=1 Tax=Jatrophihabitans sp. TaxID=1932789 RepID=UPI003F7FCFEA
MSDLSVVEICAGAGGQSLGLHLAGFRHRLAVELDPTAASTLRYNLGRLAEEDDAVAQPHVAVGDVADERVWTPAEHPNVSLLAGGVPCPPFSVAGKQLGSSDERDLFAWAVEAAGQMQPDAILLENVAGLASTKFSGYRQAVVDRLSELGYLAAWQILQAKDYGVPQLRPRFVLVGLRPEHAPYFRWPEPKPATDTVGTRLYDLMAANGWRGAEEWARRANGIAPTLVGGSKKHGGPDLGPTRARAQWRALGVDGLGIANMAPGAEAPVTLLPKLTVDMTARLQGWYGAEYDWHFLGGKTARYRQIGNAFPPPVARAVGTSIAAALRKEGAPVERPPAEAVVHDPVYRTLRSAATPLTAARIAKLSGGRLTTDEVTRAVQNLDRDFEVTVRTVRGEAAFVLGEWRAFRGQDGHLRHLAFASRRSRAQVS